MTETISRPTSRPLSEISENEDIRRVSARVSTYSLKTVSRPASEVRGDDKRIPVHTITLNLAEYTTTAPTTPKLAPASVTVTAPTPVSSAAKPPKPEKPAELAGRPLVSEDIVVDLSEPSEGPPFVLQSLRPSHTGPISTFDKSPTLSDASLDSPRSSFEVKSKPKPKWLRRASMNPVLRAKSRSPAASPTELPEPGSPNFSAARKFPSSPVDILPPPQHPARDTIASSYQGSSSQGRRWMGSSVVRSSSNNSIASTASQRIPSALGNAVSKTWLRARGVGGSMSISALGQLREPDSASSSFSRSPSRNLSSVTPPPPEPYVWPEGALKRGGRNTRGHVFGKPLDITGRTWGVVDASEDRDDEAEYAQRRRRCLPAVASRCVEYLTFWGPQEEGIFRISGRSSHINRLRYLFDAGGDLDLVKCAPSEMDESDPDPLDPHAVASLFKSFIRELPEPILTPFVEGKLDDFRGDDINVDDLATVIAMLSSSSWFLLADIIMLIDLIPRHASVNRMTHNALMISLGPTLRLSGEHVALLLRHREHIFEKPPLVSADQINFGSDDEIALSPAFDETPLPITSTPSPVMVPLATGPKPRPMSRLSKRPSFSNLLSNSIRRSQSEHLLPVSITSVGPPRLVTEFPSDDIQEEIEPEVKADVKSTDAIQETHYAPGTVAERARVFSTPIADRFRRDSILQDLRPPESSSSSISSHSSVRSSSDLAAPPNPIAGLRRSPPLFFQSTSASAGDSIAVVGTKRNADAGTGEAPGGAKRLSSGPGPED